MADESYAMDYSPELTGFLFRRRAARQAAFFTPYLEPGMTLLDAGCGPGSITVDLAELVAPGQVTGIDIDEGMLQLAAGYAKQRGVGNVRFEPGDLTQLAYPDESFDAVFVHGVIEYLDKERAFAEIYRVLKPGGVVGARHGDFGGFLVYPEQPEFIESLALFARFLTRIGGDPHCGRNQFAVMRQVGFRDLKVSASYDCWTETREEARAAVNWSAIHCTSRDYVEAMTAMGLSDRSRLEEIATAVRAFGEDENAFAAEAWGEAVAWKP
jgi:SAM-dependent methyltransferase